MRKLLIIFTIISSALLVLLTGCKKSDPTSYNSPAMVYFYNAPGFSTNDSSIYSFAIKPNSLMLDTVRIPIRITGIAQNQDRVVNVQVIAASSTAVAGQDYQILPCKILAGQYSGTLNIQVIRNTPAMTIADRALQLQLVASSDFIPGISNTVSTSSTSTTTFTTAGGVLNYQLKINDYLSMPSNWNPYLASYFGTYSRVKYKFMIDVTGGVYDYPAGPAFPPAIRLSVSQLVAYLNQFVDALNIYNATHSTPLRDEHVYLLLLIQTRNKT